MPRTLRMNHTVIESLLAPLLLAHACVSSPMEYGTVELAVGIPTDRDLAGFHGTLGVLTDVDGLLVTIRDNTGADIYTSERIALYAFNGDYVSHPLSLVPGSYSVTELLVVDPDDAALYAAPVVGSPLAPLVTTPLPIAFTTAPNLLTKVYPQVVEVAGYTPEAFGYGTYNVQFIDSIDFLVAVFVYSAVTKTLELTTARLEITDAAGLVIYNGLLGPLTTPISFIAESSIFRLTITKPGFKSYYVELTAAELEAFFAAADGGPMEVVLERIPLFPSCLEVLNSGFAVGDGIYRIDPDGEESVEAFDAYCDMTTDGGGWTLAATIANDKNDYWTWAQRHYLYDGGVYGDIANALTSDYQSAAWQHVPGSALLFKADNLATKYLRYDSVLGKQSLAALYPEDNATIGPYDADRIEGSWFQQCGDKMSMRLMGPDSDMNSWDEAAVGFVWKSSADNGCDWDDSLGGINLSSQAEAVREQWGRADGFYPRNFSTALNVFVR